jgi:kinesin family protein 3/17
MNELKREYEEKLQEVAESVKTSESNVNVTASDDPKDETKITDRIKSIKDILIGGERANDTQLKEKRYKKKLAAQKKLK